MVFKWHYIAMQKYRFDEAVANLYWGIFELLWQANLGEVLGLNELNLT